MNAPVTMPFAAAKLAPINDTFEAWHENGEPIDLSNVLSLDEAIERATAASAHKGGFTILSCDARQGIRMLRMFRVKRSTKHFTSRQALDGGYPVRVGKLEAALVFATRVAAFEPVAPWRWTAGDPTGARHSGHLRNDTIEMRS